eukprot:NODE_835_length_1162_cov_209.182390_g588_i0.p2 GENE.NODE_835_length_1162_cov_209.182390_g588_i0~~NODE_835_length_1162_cov_209.182390_g588_i0.p2  ORF type:complete len:190 (+),score=30.83 NODE_835_length_1162_cov_209.182390_g588_i0:229-798(+)
MRSAEKGDGGKEVHGMAWGGATPRATHPPTLRPVAGRRGGGGSFAAASSHVHWGAGNRGGLLQGAALVHERPHVLLVLFGQCQHTRGRVRDNGDGLLVARCLGAVACPAGGNVFVGPSDDLNFLAAAHPAGEGRLACLAQHANRGQLVDALTDRDHLADWAKGSTLEVTIQSCDDDHLPRRGAGVGKRM